MQNQSNQMEEEELEDLPDLIHQSSLRQQTDPQLPTISVETYEAKRHFDEHNNELINNYMVIKQLGKGAFGSVYEVHKSQLKFALKVCNTHGLEKQRFFAADMEFANAMDLLRNQLNIVKRIDHKNIAKCLEIIYGTDKIYIVAELGTLGQLMLWKQLENNYQRNPQIMTYLSQKYKTHSLFDIVRIIFIQVCQGVQYLHRSNITNRDIKVDNILGRTSEGAGDEIIIVDFSTVRYKGGDDISYFPTGTPGFRGPEHQFASTEGYSSKAADIWTVGMCMYTFYYQKLPFYGEDQLEMDCKSKNEPLVFDQQCPKLLVQIITKMCKKEWKERIGIAQALQLLKKQQ